MSVSSSAAWRTTGGVLMALTVAAGLVSAWSWLGRQSEVQNQTYRQPVTAVDLEVDGSVVLDAGADGEVTVERRLTWSAGRPEVSEIWDGSVLHVSARCKQAQRLPGCAVAYRLRVPGRASVTVHTRSGGVTAHDLAGGLRLTASAGDVEVTGTAGPVWVQADTGQVRGLGLRSRAVTVNGDSGGVLLQFATSPDSVGVRTGSGDVELQVPADDGYAVDADSASGHRTVVVRTDPAAARKLTARTGSGDVRISYSGA